MNCHQCGNPLGYGHYPWCDLAIHLAPWQRTHTPNAWERAAERYRRADIVDEGKAYHRRHPIVTAIAGTFGVSTVITYWPVMVPLLAIGIGVAVFVGRVRYARRTLAELEARADAELAEMRRLGELSTPVSNPVDNYRGEGPGIGQGVSP